MGLFHNVTRGGQVHIHQIRMIRQVIWFGLLVSLCSGGGYFAVKTYCNVPSWAWQTVWEYHIAQFNVATQPASKKSLVTQTWVPPQGRPFLRTSLSILTDRAILETVFLTENWLRSLFWKSVRIGGWSFLVALLGWSFMGLNHQRKKKHRGNSLVSPRSLARKLRWTFKASDLTLGKLPLVKDSETRHILISGAIGAGKSNTFHTLLPQIRERGNRALVVDVEGEMVSRYYREGRDILLNPFDVRGVYWDLWQELETESLYKVFASAVIPPLKGVKDPLWENAARKVLMAALKKFRDQGETCPQKLYSLLVYAKSCEYETFFEGTEAATFTQEKGEKFTLSVRASLEQYLDFFKHLPTQKNEKSFSLRQWVHQEKDDSWVFISSKEDWRLSMVPLISGWTDLAMSAFMSLPKDRKRRLWVVLDELPALNALPCMMNSLARTRKYGGCVMAGVQNFKQLELTYGRTEAEVLMDLFSTKVFYRNSEQGTAEWVARALGEREETEVIENLSYGANTMRDGVSLNQQTKRTPLVLPTEITMLKDFEAFVKLPGKYPVTKVKIPLVKGRDIAQEFIPLSLEKQSPSENSWKADDVQKKQEDKEIFEENEQIEEGTEVSSFLPACSRQEDIPYGDENTQGTRSNTVKNVSYELENLESRLKNIDSAVKTKYRAVLSLLLKEAQRGRIYTASSFSARFEGLGGLGSAASIASVLQALSIKNILQYFMDGHTYGFEFCKSGYLWAPGMTILKPGVLDEEGNDVYVDPLPTHAKDPTTGVLRAIEEA